jgi:hypothetical protein
LKACLSDVEGFLNLVQGDRRAAEDRLLGYVKVNRGRLAPGSLRGHLAAVRSLLNYFELSLKWRRVYAAVPSGGHVALDRAPTVDEIRRLLGVCELRMKVAVLIMASSGMRVGGFDGLKIRDIVRLDSGCGRILVYAGEPEQYYSFISPEVLAFFEEYLELRRNAGEKLTPDSPVIRDKWSFQNRPNRIDPAIVKPLNSGAVRELITLLYRKAGVDRSVRRGRCEFQACHGFRKWFKTQAQQVIRNPEDVEVLMGHRKSYYKPTLQHLEEEYLKALPYLTVAESEKLKRELEDREVKHKGDFTELRLAILEKDKEMRDMRGELAALRSDADEFRHIMEALKRSYGGQVTLSKKD